MRARNQVVYERLATRRQAHVQGAAGRASVDIGGAGRLVDLFVTIYRGASIERAHIKTRAIDKNSSAKKNLHKGTLWHDALSQTQREPIV